MPTSYTHNSVNARNQETLQGRKQFTLALVLALLPILFLGLSGCILFVGPSTILARIIEHHGSSNDQHLSLLNLQLARVVGIAFLGQSVSCLALLHPLLVFIFSTSFQHLTIGNPKDESTVEKFRSIVASLSLMGLLLLVSGLIDNRSTATGSESLLQSTFVIGSGAFVLVFACGSMMASFWPPSPPIPESLNSDTANATASAMDEENLSTPLLPQPPDDEAPPLEAQPPALTEEMTEEPTSRIRGTQRLLKLAAPQVFYLYVGCAALLVRLPFSLAMPHFVSTALGAVSRGDYSGARMEVLLLFILGTIDAALDFWCVFLFGYANLKIVRGVRIDTFVSILRQEVSFFDKTTSGELASRLNSDCGEMAGDLTWFFRFSIEAVVRITGIVSYMLIRCPTLGLCALTIIPAVAVVNKFYSRFLNENAAAVQEALANANQVAQETFSCIRTVIAFASEQQQSDRYKESIDEQYRLSVRQLYVQAGYYMVVSTFLINTIVQGTLLLIGISLIQRGKLTGEILLAFMLYQGQLQSEVMNLLNSFTSLVKSSGAGDKVFFLLDRRPAAPGTGSSEVLSSEAESAVSQPETSNQQNGQSNGTVTASIESGVGGSKHSCSVEMEGIGFAYPTRPDNTVLDNFNLSIPQGKTVALVGASGCGKSTVVGLLQRYYDPRAGSISIDGVDLRDHDIKVHRRRIGIVTQDPILFQGTILSNITYGCEASREEAEEAARLANALTFINSFPDKFETDVGERGVQLSGGQKQRIAIARAIVRKPALLLLDEATSALDAESEQLVQDALDTLLKSNSDMTTVVVAHRLRTVRNADIIAFIEKGEVIESGTHDELIKLPNGHYSLMVARASGGQLPDH